MNLSANEIEKDLERWIKNFDGKATNLMTLCGAFNLINHQKEEIKRLENLFETEHLMITELNKAFDNIKSEAYKEFAERLKEDLYYCETIVGENGKFGYPSEDVKECIDNTAKEMG